MGYQQPAFMISHPASLIGLADITLRPNTIDLSDDSKRAFIDSRQGEQGSFTGTGALAGVTFDLGASPGQTINQWILPAGHNLAGNQWDLFSKDAAGAGTFRVIQTITGTDVGDFYFPTLETTDAEWRLFNGDGSATKTYTFGEFWLGDRVAISSGYVQPGFTNEWEHHIAEDVIGGRDIALELTPPRRRFSLEIRYVVPATSDALILEEILRLGRSTPFWYWTPDDTDTGPYLVKLEDSATRAQESAAPQAQIAYTVSLTMIEQTT
jgi:hypothetical protein